MLEANRPWAKDRRCVNNSSCVLFPIGVDPSWMRVVLVLMWTTLTPAITSAFRRPSFIYRPTPATYSVLTGSVSSSECDQQRRKRLVSNLEPREKHGASLQRGRNFGSTSLLYSSESATEFAVTLDDESGSGNNMYQGELHCLTDESTWQLYTEIMREVMQRDRVVEKFKKTELGEVPDYLLRSGTVPGLSTPPFLACQEGSTSDSCRVDIRDSLREQQLEFMQHYNLTAASYDYCSRCLVYLTDSCAKKKLPGPVLWAWSKVREIGLAPGENALSTFLYVLSLPLDVDADTTAESMHTESADEATSVAIARNEMERQRKASLLEVATLRDLLYKPSENTVALRIKALIADGDAVGAEQILASLDDKKQVDSSPFRESPSTVSSSSSWKRLRTYTPILQYYCDSGEIFSALRLYREMQQSDGVYLNAETYASLISALAKHGWFSPNYNGEGVDLTSYGFTSPGPVLLDDLFSEMAADILEIDEPSANAMIEGFHSSMPPANECKDRHRQTLVGRVTIDNTTAICPESGARLRLFTLSDDQRSNVRNTLLEMAATQHEEHNDRLLARRSGGKPINKTASADFAWSGQFAVDELSKFMDWLRLRDGEDFTAIIDGPNVAYYGHGDVHWSQVELVLTKLEQMGEIPLVIMPQKYVASKFWLSSLGHTQELSERELAIMHKLLDSKKLYVVPTSCLDDYYWMISSVTEQKSNQRLQVTSEDGPGRFPGLRPLIVTNDQMRDHRLSLLEPRLFRRWTSCHIVNYDIKSYETDEWDERHVTFFPSDFFSREIQRNVAPRLADNVTAWHFPVIEWPEPDRLCISIMN